MQVDIAEIEFGGCQYLTQVFGLLNLLIQRVSFQLCLEVVPELLLLFGKTTLKKGESTVPTCRCSLLHALLSACMIFRVDKLATVEFIDLVGLPVKLLDGVLYLNQSLVKFL